MRDSELAYILFKISANSRAFRCNYTAF